MKTSTFVRKIVWGWLLGLTLVAFQVSLPPVWKSIIHSLENAGPQKQCVQSANDEPSRDRADTSCRNTPERKQNSFENICLLITVWFLAMLLSEFLTYVRIQHVNRLSASLSVYNTIDRMKKVLFTRSEHSLKEQSEELEQKISGNTSNVSGFIVSTCTEIPPVLIGLAISTFYMFCGSDWLFKPGGILHNAPDWLLDAFSGEKQLAGNFYMASFVLLASFLCMAARWIMDRDTGKRNREETSKAMERATFISMESLRGIQDIRSSNSFPFALKRLSDAKIDAERKRQKEFRHNQIFGFFSGSFIKCLMEATLVFCAAYVICHALKIKPPLTFSDYMGFTISYGIFMGYLVQIRQMIERIPQISADFGVLKEIDSLPDAFGPEIGTVPETKSTTLRFMSIHFRYPTAKTNVLAGINLEVREGEHVALVGPSGCGKSTLLKLAMRHLTPTEGVVEFGGMDIQKVNFPFYAKHVTYVSQNPFIFQGTIRDNILVGRDLGLDDDRLMEIVEDVALSDDLKRKMPDVRQALDQEIKSGGQSLSGGQMAKIALARALAGDPDILLLDEVTAAFDELSQDHVMKVLATKYRDKTIISINHRLSAVRNMDRIVVMESGRIVQEGKYDELAAKPGLFASLVARETGGTQFITSEPPQFVGDGQRDLIQALSMSPVFADVDTAELEKLVAHSETRKCTAGNYLFRKGDAGDELYVVKSGEIEINGIRHASGYSFGEIALFGRLRRTADVLVVADAEFIVLRHDDIIDVCRAYPEMAIRILQAMARIIR